jgi:hypothetical protein
MVAPWNNVVQKVLDKDDAPVKNFPGNSEKKYGYLVITKKKLVFVHESGLFKKNYEVVWEEPLADLKELEQLDRFKLELNGGGKKYVVETGELNSKVVLDAIKDVEAS